VLGDGSRRHPKLKEPDGPSGAKCRDACGPDCPGTCEVEFPNAFRCGTHAGCRTHDACYDTAVANGETYRFGPATTSATRTRSCGKVLARLGHSPTAGYRPSPSSGP
jgi:hypothetical protein